MSREPIDQFAAGQTEERRASVRLGSKAGHEKRTLAIFGDYARPDRLRAIAGQIKQHTLDHLDVYLERAAARLEANGAKVHFAADADSARRTIAGILQRRQAKRAVKAKTMVSEEIELARHLEQCGIECVETDLGEFVVQVSDDVPSHIVKPILHKNRREIARSFEAHGLGSYDDTPEVITRRARVHLRRKYLEADAAITGANFVSAESGRLVIVTNEGNARFCLAATRCHIAVVGIEKLVARDGDLALLLNLLARSATGQALSVYTELISGPRAAGQPDGPDEMHVVFLDNGRTGVLADACREILRCIRCGACLNVCPVYRQASGHAYRSVYPGPLGAVLAPLLAQNQEASGLGGLGAFAGFAGLADLPRASSLCGACNDVCPVDIPIPELLLRLRDRAHRAPAGQTGSPGSASPGPAMTTWSRIASAPALWRRALASGRLLRFLPRALRPAPLRAWEQNHVLPPWRGGAFRAWMSSRARPAR